MRVYARFSPELWIFLAPRDRRPEVLLPYDGTSSLGHVIESAGVPLTEVGGLLAGGRPVGPSYRPGPDEVVEVPPVRRPQRVARPAFLLDVHLGTLARRLRLVGLDTAYHNDRDDDALIEQANAEGRVLLTQDRGILRRRSLRLGAYVRGARPDDQMLDVLDRFRPPLAPWTRCPACNGRLAPVGKAEVEDALEPGTRRSYDEFARCLACGRVYWHGAHGGSLAAVVERARRAVSAARRAPAGRAGSG
ncbi:Mut7-C RNAse domain-containing protein [Microbispora sp. H11081]|uniref:Mut7-C RNAse domain-containing protein n=1 Tax=Microbispora sp. H11081 TaxID=2729107 RepID=UPI001473DD20|nr:Mut7-C RNAse domain-containing protein [Microbispora sp. H11081]